MSMTFIFILLLVPVFVSMKRCGPGIYGQRCDKPCNVNCHPHTNNNTYCDKDTGKCLQGCVSGWSSDQCNFPCSKTCIGNVCSQQTGRCTKGCKGIYRGDMCDEYEVPVRISKKRCGQGFYGKRCDKTCNVNCHPHTNNNTYCDKNTGKCLQGCVSGWSSDTCNFPCSKNCIDHICNQNTGWCTKGCKGNYGGDMCNEYEVPVRISKKRCGPGIYGKRCDKPCNVNCHPHTNNNTYCDKDTGKCLHGCISGWSSDKCNFPCRKNCIDHICNQQTGQCTEGCKGNHRGDMCDEYEVPVRISKKRCGPGIYGQRCDRLCNVNCHPHTNNNTYCDKDTGKCLQGCVSGWSSDQCNFPCSKTCIGNICSQQTGRCTKGCKGNYRGDMCDEYEVTRNDPPPRHDQEVTDGAKRVVLKLVFATGVLFVLVVLTAITAVLLVRCFSSK
ncbi:platelet endothelial aggregation receptor 1-like isoform X2 [Haliotis rufescens]|uniref:platelet endothelial aggregation receptor 1-like isoform X2 n=1 Tax=Haliotis rufescens TaxID=6454 RepID=UPI00201F1A03|nr:platelet endothelial aggregation receptor 1-like isoform X2 [Haliotis rufescens]